MVTLTHIQARHLAAKQALSCLKESLDIISNDPVARSYYKQMRNSAIQCFEFSIDTLWKLLKEYLLFAYKIQITAPTPKAVFQEALRVGLINQQEIEICFDIVDARNITSHTYNEDLAEKIANDLPDYYTLMQNLIERIKL